MHVRTHTVMPGENLASIADHYYNDGSQWEHIYDHNRHAVADPNAVYPGQVLIIPHLLPAIGRDFLTFIAHRDAP